MDAQSCRKSKQGSSSVRRPERPKGRTQEPVGRGQPLPPIGQPLPGPKTSLWGGSTFAGGSVKRKPVLPARRPTMEQNSADTKDGEGAAPRKDDVAKSTSDSASVAEESSADPVEDDEFGPWRDNFEQDTKESGNANASERTDETNVDGGAAHKEARTTETIQSEQATPEKKDKTPPPPLPARRKRAPELPKRPHERAESQSEDLTPTTTTYQQDDRPSESRGPRISEPDTKAQPAIPAPANNEAEQRGVLELDEADGVHVIEAAAKTETLPSEETSPRRSHEGLHSKHVTMEEVPED